MKVSKNIIFIILPSPYSLSRLLVDESMSFVIFLLAEASSKQINKKKDDCYLWTKM
jgi:hypothetical protein